MMAIPIGVGEAFGARPAGGDPVREGSVALEVGKPRVEGGVGLGRQTNRK